MNPGCPERSDSTHPSHNRVPLKDSDSYIINLSVKKIYPTGHAGRVEG